ncbi:MAG: FAD-binding oxidoreductase [Candidatus Cloacimonadota bacterium]|nr:MAG: FAD-binding oxidoreductase [Candidatus Cloacimonadota bacterium]
MRTGNDIIIIGGGIIGGSILFNLLKDGYKGKIAVFEKKNSMADESTALSAGGFRNIWSTVVNMKLTTMSIESFKNFKAETGVSIGFEQRGYLFTYYRKDWETIIKFRKFWEESGVKTELLDPVKIMEMIPGYKPGLDHLDSEIVEMLELKEIVGGLFGADCGVFNPTACAIAYFDLSCKNYRECVEINKNTEVKKLSIKDGKVDGVIVRDDCFIAGEKIILAAGAFSHDLLERSGVSEEQNIPVVPLKRMLFLVNKPPIEGFGKIPMIIIDNGVYFHPEADDLLVGRAKADQKPGYDYEMEKKYYVDIMNSYMQARIPGMEYCRIKNGWGGLYAHNTKDKNAIIGDHPDIENLIFATGFSGHGVMEAPAVGKCISEKLIQGDYVSIPEVTLLDFTRFREGRLVKETIVI